MKKISKNIQEPRLHDALLAVRHAMTSALLLEAKKLGYSLSHFEIVKYVASKGEATMKDIASHLSVTPPSASALVETLVKKGLVSRIETPNDRRTVSIVLLPAAQKIVSSVYKQKDSIFKKMLSKLSKEDKQDVARILIKCI